MIIESIIGVTLGILAAKKKAVAPVVAAAAGKPGAALPAKAVETAPATPEQRNEALIASGPAQAAAAAQASIATVIGAGTATPQPTRPGMPVSVTAPFKPTVTTNPNPSSFWANLRRFGKWPAPAKTTAGAPAPRAVPPRVAGAALKASLLPRSRGRAAAIRAMPRGRVR